MIEFSGEEAIKGFLPFSTSRQHMYALLSERLDGCGVGEQTRETGIDNVEDLPGTEPMRDMGQEFHGDTARKRPLGITVDWDEIANFRACGKCLNIAMPGIVNDNLILCLHATR
jgi:hypothetical protein